MTRYTMISFLACGVVFGYIFAKAESRGFCTGRYSSATQTCEPF